MGCFGRETGEGASILRVPAECDTFPAPWMAQFPLRPYDPYILCYRKSNTPMLFTAAFQRGYAPHLANSRLQGATMAMRQSHFWKGHSTQNRHGANGSGKRAPGYLPGSLSFSFLDLNSGLGGTSSYTCGRLLLQEYPFDVLARQEPGCLNHSTPPPPPGIGPLKDTATSLTCFSHLVLKQQLQPRFWGGDTIR